MSAAPESRTNSRSRRRTRLRSTALPTLRDTVKPTRAGPSSPRRRLWIKKDCETALRPPAAARKSARRRMRSIAASFAPGTAERLGAQALAAARAAGRDDLAAALGRDTGTEAMAALAHEFAGLIGPLHGSFSAARQSAKWMETPGTGAQGRIRKDAPQSRAAAFARPGSFGAAYRGKKPHPSTLGPAAARARPNQAPQPAGISSVRSPDVTSA